MQDDVIIEVSNEIPYKKVEEFSIQEVSSSDGRTFTLSFTYKLAGLHKEKDIYKISRSQSDISWLLTQLQQENPNLLILPSIASNFLSSAWDYIKLTLSHSEPQRKTHYNKLVCRVVRRALQIISSISLAYLYPVQGSNASSLFVFLEQGYSLYRSDIYAGEKEGTTMAENLTNKLSSLTSYVKGNRLFDYISKKAPENKELTQLRQDISIIYSRSQSIRTQIENYSSSLDVMAENFLSEKAQIRNRNSQIHEITICLEMEIKFMGIMLAEIDAILARYGHLSKNADLDQQLTAQVHFYREYVTNELQECNLVLKNNLERFYETISNQLTTKDQCKIDIGKLYVNYRKTQEGLH